MAAPAAAMISCSAPKSPWRYFTVEEAETAAALCDCLIPADDYPSASAAGAVTYLDLQLSGHLRKHRRIYRTALAALNRISREKYGASFAGLGTNRQVEMLRAIEKGKSSEQREFFGLVLAHTMQSYYGDPRHGGNRDGAGYRMLGIPATPVRGRSKHDLTTGGNPL
jgi:gluconate 2-dehydrogenase gamma chain